MRLDEYLEIVAQQIRYTKIRPDVTEELKNHILDQADAYEAQGAFPEEALERAVREMGDPVETGVALDRIHRPQMHWGIVAAIALLSCLGVGIIYVTNLITLDQLYWQYQAAYTVAGFLVMLLVYRMDYSILEIHGKTAAFLLPALLFAGFMVAPLSISGTARWISLPFFNVSISEAMLLYVPLYGSVLYAYRGEGYQVLLKLIPWTILPVFFVLQLPDLTSAMVLFTCLFCLFIFAVSKDWYQINKRAVIGISSAIVILSPLLLIGYFYFFGETYQTARIQAFFTQTGDANYMLSLTRKLRQSSAMIGSSREALELFSNGPAPEYLTDFTLVSMCCIYGTLAAVAVIAGLLLIILKVFHISVTQKNQLGMIVGTGCGLVFFVETVIGILINLQLIPYVSISMPFLSYGGSSVLVSYILLGLVLSVYRYKNILPSKGRTALNTL